MMNAMTSEKKFNTLRTLALHLAEEQYDGGADYDSSIFTENAIRQLLDDEKHTHLIYNVGKAYKALEKKKAHRGRLEEWGYKAPEEEGQK